MDFDTLFSIYHQHFNLISIYGGGNGDNGVCCIHVKLYMLACSQENLNIVFYRLYD